MAAKPAFLASSGAQVQFWQKFQALAEQQVRECNIIAGERLWRTRISSIPEPRFRVESTVNPGDFVECSMDFAAAVLICTPGPAIRTGVVRLELFDGTLTPEQAVTTALDELVCTDRLNTDSRPGATEEE